MSTLGVLPEVALPVGEGHPVELEPDLPGLHVLQADPRVDRGAAPRRQVNVQAGRPQEVVLVQPVLVLDT